MDVASRRERRGQIKGAARPALVAREIGREAVVVVGGASRDGFYTCIAHG